MFRSAVPFRNDPIGFGWHCIAMDRILDFSALILCNRVPSLTQSSLPPAKFQSRPVRPGWPQLSLSRPLFLDTRNSDLQSHVSAFLHPRMYWQQHSIYRTMGTQKETSVPRGRKELATVARSMGMCLKHVCERCTTS